jgi:CelD/BcsL family acetyltransferase involved in cellulose biosynthesis
MAPSTSDYEKVPRADDDIDAVVRSSASGDSDSDDAMEYIGRTKRRSLAEDERTRYDAETLGGQEEAERLLVSGNEKRRTRRARGELRKLEQGGKSETSSVSGGDESPVRIGQYTEKVS